MGIVKSRIKIDAQLGNSNGSKPKRNNNGSKPKNVNKQVDEYEDVELMQLRMSITKDPNSYILNNLMMCIQFFENYEE